MVLLARNEGNSGGGSGHPHLYRPGADHAPIDRPKPQRSVAGRSGFCGRHGAGCSHYCSGEHCSAVSEWRIRGPDRAQGHHSGRSRTVRFDADLGRYFHPGTVHARSRRPAVCRLGNCHVSGADRVPDRRPDPGAVGLEIRAETWATGGSTRTLVGGNCSRSHAADRSQQDSDAVDCRSGRRCQRFCGRDGTKVRLFAGGSDRSVVDQLHPSPRR